MKIFKINNETADKVLSECGNARNEKILDLVNEIKVFLNKYGFLYGDLVENIGVEIMKEYVHCPNLKNMVIKDAQVFDKCELNKLEEIDDNYSKLLEVLSFEYSILDKQRDNELKKLDVDNTIKISRTLNDIRNKIDNLKLEIANKNAELDVRYNEYVSIFSNLEKDIINCVKSPDNLKEFFEKYTQKMISDYLVKQIIGKALAKLENNKELIEELFDYCAMKDIFGEKKSLLKEEMLRLCGNR